MCHLKPHIDREGQVYGVCSPAPTVYTQHIVWHSHSAVSNGLIIYYIMSKYRPQTIIRTTGSTVQENHVRYFHGSRSFSAACDVYFHQRERGAWWPEVWPAPGSWLHPWPSAALLGYIYWHDTANKPLHYLFSSEYVTQTFRIRNKQSDRNSEYWCGKNLAVKSDTVW